MEISLDHNNSVIKRLCGINYFIVLCFTALQDYFTYFEPSPPPGGANIGDPCI